MQTHDELMQERAAIYDKMRAMNDKAMENGRDFSGEEKDKYERMEADAETLKVRAQRLKKLDDADREMAQRTSASAKPVVSGPLTPEEQRGTPEYKAAFRDFLVNGDTVTPEIRATLQKAVTTQGGFLVPIEYETTIVRKMYDANIMRQLGTVVRTTSQVNIPMEGNLPTFSWIDELGTYGATDLTLGQKILNAWKLGGIVTVSEELMQDAFLDVSAYISDRSGQAAGFAEESAFIIGDGNKKPTGWVTDAIAGNGSGAATTLANNNITSVDMFALMYAVPRPYRKNGKFVVADSAIQKLRQEKATTGQYLWQPALTADAPDVYFGKPIYTSDFLAPFAASSVSAAFGDFSHYQIVDRVGWSMQKLDQLYAANGQVGFRMWERTDGRLLRPEAVALLTTHV